jgi:hypothetical protein
MTDTATPPTGVDQRKGIRTLALADKFAAFQAMKDAKQQGVDKITEDGVIIEGKAIHRSLFDAAVEKLSQYAPPIQVVGTSSGEVFGVPAQKLLATTRHHWEIESPAEARVAGLAVYIFSALIAIACAIIIVFRPMGYFK